MSVWIRTKPDTLALLLWLVISGDILARAGMDNRRRGVGSRWLDKRQARKHQKLHKRAEW